MIIMMQIALQFRPGPDDFAHGALATLFEVIPRVALGSLAAYIISQYFDVWIYNKTRSLFPSDKFLWIRNNGSTAISQLLDSIVFCSIAFFGEYLFSVWLEILMTTYMIKFIVALVDTPFMYMAANMKNQG